MSWVRRVARYSVEDASCLRGLYQRGSAGSDDNDRSVILNGRSTARTSSGISKSRRAPVRRERVTSSFVQFVFRSVLKWHTNGYTPRTATEQKEQIPVAEDRAITSSHFGTQLGVRNFGRKTSAGYRRERAVLLNQVESIRWCGTLPVSQA